MHSKMQGGNLRLQYGALYLAILVNWLGSNHCYSRVSAFDVIETYVCFKAVLAQYLLGDIF